nr:hypothetical protein CFP56_62585 [Quercus suber]
MLDEEVVKESSKHVINLPGARFDPKAPKETKKSQEWKQLYEQSQKWMLDEEVVKQISKHVINLPGARLDPKAPLESS